MEFNRRTPKKLDIGLNNVPNNSLGELQESLMKTIPICSIKYDSEDGIYYSSSKTVQDVSELKQYGITLPALYDDSIKHLIVNDDTPDEIVNYKDQLNSWIDNLEIGNQLKEYSYLSLGLFKLWARATISLLGKRGNSHGISIWLVNDKYLKVTQYLSIGINTYTGKLSFYILIYKSDSNNNKIDDINQEFLLILLDGNIIDILGNVEKIEDTIYKVTCNPVIGANTTERIITVQYQEGDYYGNITLSAKIPEWIGYDCNEYIIKSNSNGKNIFEDKNFKLSNENFSWVMLNNMHLSDLILSPDSWYLDDSSGLLEISVLPEKVPVSNITYEQNILPDECISEYLRTKLSVIKYNLQVFDKPTSGYYNKNISWYYYLKNSIGISLLFLINIDPDRDQKKEVILLTSLGSSTIEKISSNDQVEDDFIFLDTLLENNVGLAIDFKIVYNEYFEGKNQKLNAYFTGVVNNNVFLLKTIETGYTEKLSNCKIELFEEKPGVYSLSNSGYLLILERLSNNSSENNFLVYITELDVLGNEYEYYDNNIMSFAININFNFNKVSISGFNNSTFILKSSEMKDNISIYNYFSYPKDIKQTGEFEFPFKIEWELDKESVTKDEIQLGNIDSTILKEKITAEITLVEKLTNNKFEVYVKVKGCLGPSWKNIKENPLEIPVTLPGEKNTTILVNLTLEMPDFISIVGEDNNLKFFVLNKDLVSEVIPLNSKIQYCFIDSGSYENVSDLSQPATGLFYLNSARYPLTNMRGGTKLSGNIYISNSNTEWHNKYAYATTKFKFGYHKNSLNDNGGLGFLYWNYRSNYNSYFYINNKLILNTYYGSGYELLESRQIPNTISLNLSIKNNSDDNLFTFVTDNKNGGNTLSQMGISIGKGVKGNLLAFNYDNYLNKTK